MPRVERERAMGWLDPRVFESSAASAAIGGWAAATWILLLGSPLGRSAAPEGWRRLEWADLASRLSVNPFETTKLRF